MEGWLGWGLRGRAMGWDKGKGVTDGGDRWMESLQGFSSSSFRFLLLVFEMGMG